MEFRLARRGQRVALPQAGRSRMVLPWRRGVLVSIERDTYYATVLTDSGALETSLHLSELVRETDYQDAVDTLEENATRTVQFGCG